MTAPESEGRRLLRAALTSDIGEGDTLGPMARGSLIGFASRDPEMADIIEEYERPRREARRAELIAAGAAEIDRVRWDTERWDGCSFGSDADVAAVLLDLFLANGLRDTGQPIGPPAERVQRP